MRGIFFEQFRGYKPVQSRLVCYYAILRNEDIT